MKRGSKCMAGQLRPDREARKLGAGAPRGRASGARGRSAARWSPLADRLCSRAADVPLRHSDLRLPDECARLRPYGRNLARRPEASPSSSSRTPTSIVFNTCSVREKAEQKLRSEVGKLAPLKRARPDLVIAVAGCVAQQEGEALLARIRHIDLVVGPDNMAELPALVIEQMGGAPPVARTEFDIAAPRFLSWAPARVGAGARDRARDDHEGLRRALQLLRRPLHARTRALSPGARDRRRGAAVRRRGLARGAPPRADRRQLPRRGPAAPGRRRPGAPRNRAGGSDAVPAPPARHRAGRPRPRAPALHEPAPAPRHGLARARARRARRARATRAPAGAVRAATGSCAG